MLKLENVNKYFNKNRKNQIHVIDNTTLEFNDNGLVAFLGPSGSGKTTLLNIIGGLDHFGSGKIFINNKKITKYNYCKMDKIRDLSIGYIFQDYKLIDNLTVYDNVALVLKMIGIKDKEEIRKRVTFVLEATGIYRYRNRLASMLSGGERQRVGIARALVKNPDIILADEPTGNLDSKNSIEVMNIIKAISKDRLVILVTHEVTLANFYADRIVQIQDGKVISDKKNKNDGDLDYRIENKIYLKDFEEHSKLKKEDLSIDVYSNQKEKVNISIVFKNGNLYIKNDDNIKIEVLDDNSSIELVNDHYKKINQKEVEKYSFDLDKVVNKDIKLKYASIYNLFTLLIDGFKKVFNYPILKKLLLIGFFVTGIFIVYSVSGIFAAIKIDEKQFVTKNKNYLSLQTTKISLDDYNRYSNFEGVNYILPSNSIVELIIEYDNYLQAVNSVRSNFKSSISSINMIDESDLVYGVMPTRGSEVVIDLMVLNRIIDEGYSVYVGINKPEEFLGLKITDGLGRKYKIVGITDKVSPSLYVQDSEFINFIAYQISDNNYEGGNQIVDYPIMGDEIRLVKGRLPANDYEVIVSEVNEYSMPLDKEIDTKVNDHKLKVVGYYHSDNDYSYYLVNQNTVKYNLVSKATELVIYSNDSEKTLESFRNEKLNINNTYELDKEKYINKMKDDVREKLITAGVIIAISLVEIFLMIRSSFLSRVKEIGILRAIGVKKTDVMKMFLGEIIAITSTAGLLGIFVMIYIIKTLRAISMFRDMFVLDLRVVLISIVIMYTFNIVVGLLPVFNVLRHTPASILSRHDIE